MSYAIPVKTKKLIKFIAYYQIIGGIIGELFVVKGLIQLDVFSIFNIVITLFAGSVFAFSILCGQRLLTAEIQKALKLSTINQLVQFFSISILGLSYRYAAGLYLGIGFDFTDSFLIGFSFELPQFKLYYKSTSAEAALQINAMALLLLYLIGRIKKEIQQGLALFNSLLPLDQENVLLLAQTETFLEDKG
jgi:hypothetical protein